MAYEYYHNLVNNPVWVFCWSAFTGFIGGHRLALGRDRRIEFNNAAEKFFLIVTDERSRPSPFNDNVADEAAVFRRHLHWWQRRKFDSALKRYVSARHTAKKKDSTGGLDFQDTTEIENTLKELIRFTKRK